LKAFKSELGELSTARLLQVSMDGPNVNFRFLNYLKVALKNESPGSPVLLDLGSCGIHTVHNSFKAGAQATGWLLIEFLRGIYNTFKDVPARRSDYTFFSESEVFPMKFCGVRWLENDIVAERAIKIVPNL